VLSAGCCLRNLRRLLSLHKLVGQIAISRLEKDPDRRVQEAIILVFDKVAELGSESRRRPRDRALPPLQLNSNQPRADQGCLGHAFARYSIAIGPLLKRFLHGNLPHTAAVG